MNKSLNTWNELHNVLGKPAEVGFSEDYDFRERLFIDSLIHKYKLHECTDGRVFPADIIPSLIRQQFQRKQFY